MFAQTLFTSLTAVYIVLMGLISLIGTAALLKLMVVLLKKEPRQGTWMEMNIEDA